MPTQLSTNAQFDRLGARRFRRMTQSSRQGAIAWRRAASKEKPIFFLQLGILGDRNLDLRRRSHGRLSGWRHTVPDDWCIPSSVGRNSSCAIWLTREEVD